MNTRSCPELRAAALDGRRTPDDAHLRACSTCASERAAMDEIAGLVRGLDPTPPGRERLDEIRGALLALPDPRPQALYHRRPPAWVWGAASAAAVALLALGFTLATSDPAHLEPAPLRAHVQSAASTQFVHRAAPAPGVPERVELREGLIHLEVAPMIASERFVVVTDDAEVEVRGTVFEVVASAGALSRVHVIAGKVEVRWRGAPAVEVKAGQTWTPGPRNLADEVRRNLADEVRGNLADEVRRNLADEVGGRAAPESPAPAAPVVEPSTEPEEAEDPAARADRARAQRTRASERAFRDAWATFARSDMVRAAELFAEVERLSPGSPLAEDALYGRCVALERADQRDEAVRELRRYLRRYPSGARSDEVALALAAFEAEAGAHDEARRLYGQALASPVDTIRSRARAGLDALKARP